MWLVAVVGRCVVGCEHCEVLASYNAKGSQKPAFSLNSLQILNQPTEFMKLCTKIMPLLDSTNGVIYF